MFKLNVKKEKDRYKSQYAKILSELKEKGSLTNHYMDNHFHGRWHARIVEMRKDGYIIVASNVKDSKWNYIYKGHKEESK